MGAAEKAAHKNGGAQVNSGGRPRTDLGLLLDALFYGLRNADPWRDLPEHFGPWSTIHGWHARWAREGLWAKLGRSRAGVLQRSRTRLSTEIVRSPWLLNPNALLQRSRTRLSAEIGKRWADEAQRQAQLQRSRTRLSAEITIRRGGLIEVAVLQRSRTRLSAEMGQRP